MKAFQKVIKIFLIYSEKNTNVYSKFITLAQIKNFFQSMLKIFLLGQDWDLLTCWETCMQFRPVETEN